MASPFLTSDGATGDENKYHIMAIDVPEKLTDTPCQNATGDCSNFIGFALINYRVLTEAPTGVQTTKHTGAEEGARDSKSV